MEVREKKEGRELKALLAGDGGVQRGEEGKKQPLARVVGKAERQRGWPALTHYCAHSSEENRVLVYGREGAGAGEKLSASERKKKRDFALQPSKIWILCN